MQLKTNVMLDYSVETIQFNPIIHTCHKNRSQSSNCRVFAATIRNKLHTHVLHTLCVSECYYIFFLYHVLARIDLLRYINFVGCLKNLDLQFQNNYAPVFGQQFNIFVFRVMQKVILLRCLPRTQWQERSQKAAKSISGGIVNINSLKREIG